MRLSYLSAGLFLLAGSTGAQVQTPPSQSDALIALKRWHQTSLIPDQELAPYKQLGKKALPLFAPYLRDKDLAPLADLAMQEIDSIDCAPYLIAAADKRDEAFQIDLFRSANRAMAEYDLYLRAGQPKPTDPPPRYPTNTQPYPFKKEVRQAALEIALDKTRTRPMRPAFEAIGLAGSRRDIRMLKRFAGKEDQLPDEASDAYGAMAALARLGDKKTLDWISKELEMPTQTEPEQPWSGERGGYHQPTPGAIVTPEPEGQRLRKVMYLAQFSMNRRFVPVLIRHLEDARGQFHGDYADPSPPDCASQALGWIAQGTINVMPAEYWRAWWAKTKTHPK